MTTEHEFTFEATITRRIVGHFEEEEYQDLARDDESREAFARRRALERAPRRLSMDIADDGVSAESIDIGDVVEHTEY